VSDPSANTLTLKRPITAHGQEVTTLTFRELTGGDLASCGVPFTLGANDVVEIKADAMARMISTLASIPPSSVAQMKVSDWMAAAGKVVGFFGDTTPEKS
jgi:hypothetical protein